MKRARRPHFAKAAWVTAALLLVLAAPAASAADAPRKVELELDAARSALVHSRLAGPLTHEYTFDARRGDILSLAFDSDWSQLVAIYLLPPGVDTPLYTNFIDGTTRWEGVAPGTGTYTVRLQFLRSESRRNGLVDYDLQVKLGESPRLASRRPVRVAEGSAAGR